MKDDFYLRMKPQKKRGKIRILLLIGVPILIFQIITMSYQKFKVVGWVDNAMPYTEKFLRLLSERKYEKIYEQYAKNSGIASDVLVMQMEKITKTYGNIKSYKYTNYSVSKAAYSVGGAITGFFIGYKITLDNQKTCNCSFSFYIDKKSNSPIFDRISSFTINRDFGADQFYLKLDSD